MESEMLNKKRTRIFRKVIKNMLSNIRFSERNLPKTRDWRQIHHCWHVDYMLYFPELLGKYTCSQINATGIMWALLSQCFTIPDANLFFNSCTHVWNLNTSAAQRLDSHLTVVWLTFLSRNTDKPFTDSGTTRSSLVTLCVDISWP